MKWKPIETFPKPTPSDEELEQIRREFSDPKESGFFLIQSDRVLVTDGETVSIQRLRWVYGRKLYEKSGAIHTGYEWVIDNKEWWDMAKSDSFMDEPVTVFDHGTHEPEPIEPTHWMPLPEPPKQTA